MSRALYKRNWIDEGEKNWIIQRKVIYPKRAGTPFLLLRIFYRFTLLLHAIKNQLYYRWRYGDILTKQGKIFSTAAFNPILSKKFLHQMNHTSSKYLEIIKLVRQYQPKKVLELGSGRSSILFEELSKSHNFELTSLEEEKKFSDEVKKVCDKAPIVCKRIEIVKDQEAVSYYDYDVGETFDLVYVDGPLNNALSYPEHVRDTKEKKIPNVNVELMWDKNIMPPVIVIDGRHVTVTKLLQRNESQLYDVYFSSYFSMYALNKVNFNFQFHTIFILKK